MNATKTGVDSDGDSPRRVRVVIYARTNRPDSVLSIQDQCESVREYAVRHDMEVVRVYEDVGKSGSSLDGRDAMKRLLAEATSPDRDFDVILVYDWSRWGRFLDAGTYYEHLCRRAGVELRACSEPPADDDHPACRMAQQIRRAVAASDKTRFPRKRSNPCMPPGMRRHNIERRRRWKRQFRG